MSHNYGASDAFLKRGYSPGIARRNICHKRTRGDDFVIYKPIFKMLASQE